MDDIFSAWESFMRYGLDPRKQGITLSYDTVNALFEEIEMLSYRIKGEERAD